MLHCPDETYPDFDVKMANCWKTIFGEKFYGIELFQGCAILSIQRKYLEIPLSTDIFLWGVNIFFLLVMKL